MPVAINHVAAREGSAAVLDDGFAETAVRSDIIEIGLVNNMTDAALAGTVRSPVIHSQTAARLAASA